MQASVPVSPVWAWIAGFVALNTAINLFGVRMTAMVTRWFLAGELAVVWQDVVRERSRNRLAHLVSPLLGVGLLVAVAIHANVLAQKVGLTWLAVGIVVRAALWLPGRRRPTLSGMAAVTP